MAFKLYFCELAVVKRPNMFFFNIERYRLGRSAGALAAGFRWRIACTQTANERQTHHRGDIHILETLHVRCMKLRKWAVYATSQSGLWSRVTIRRWKHVAPGNETPGWTEKEIDVFVRSPNQAWRDFWCLVRFGLVHTSLLYWGTRVESVMERTMVSGSTFAGIPLRPRSHCIGESRGLRC